MKAKKFWILLLIKNPGSETIEVEIVSSDVPPRSDRDAQIISLSTRRSELERLKRKKEIKAWFGTGGFINPRGKTTSLSISSHSMRLIVYRATGDDRIFKNEEIVCGKGGWYFFIFSDGDHNPFNR